MPSSSNRVYKVADQIQRDLATVIQQELKDPRIGLVTINDVKVSSDLSYANVYFTCMAFGQKGSESEDQSQKIKSEQEKVLNNAAGFLRSRLASEFKLRVMPKIKFHYDSVIDTSIHISNLIDEARARDQGYKEHQGNSEDKDGEQT